jgi:glutamate synthase (NADPH/NADH) small chain
MADIDYADEGSMLNPLRAWAFFGRKPVTEPLQPRPASPNYRGFHLNDWEKCIGCGACQKLCDTAAISMVRIPDLPADPARGERSERPAIDYGRCCWCGLCVDICPTGSLTLSREYVHTCTDEEVSSCLVLPDAKGIHGEHYGHGWTKTSESDLVDLRRRPMRELEPGARSAGFDEIVAGYDEGQALLEASRCVQCGMCRDACPARMDAPGYIRAIWQGRVEEAVRLIYETNPFAHVCGRVCTHRCEEACPVGRRGEPVAIRWLKRYAMDAVPHERVVEIAAAGRGATASGGRVAIVGAGPAGLTAAFDLARSGHEVTVFEALDQPGGMARWGIPAYRLPQDRLDRDIDVIRAMGVDIRCNVRIGEDLALQQLRRDYDAVLIAPGLQTGRSSGIPNSDHPQVREAVRLLREFAAGENIRPPKSAVVIGSDSVAIDTARIIVRLQRRRYGAVRVTVAALEDFGHFPADPVELRQAREEGVEILDARGPQECLVDGSGRLTGLRTWRVESLFDAEGRFAPSYDPADERIHDGEMIVEAASLMADTGLLGDALAQRLQWDLGRLRVDDQGRTSESWLWAAGDLVRGPDVVSAVADGHRAAAGIHAWLSQRNSVD